MYIKKHGKGHQVQIKRKQGSIYKTFKARTEAKEWGIKTEARLLASGHHSKSKAFLADVLARYAAEISPSKRGARWEILRLNAFQKDPIASLMVSKISESDLADWQNRRASQVSAGTVIRERNLLRSVFEMCRKVWKHTNTNPFADVQRPRAPPHRDRRISPVEIEAILGRLTQDLDTVSGRVGLAFEFAIETGMRAGEICGIKTNHIFDSYVELPKTKNGSIRKVPLSKSARRILETLLNHKNSSNSLTLNGTNSSPSSVFDIKTSQIDSLFRKAKKALNIHDLHFHDTRHEAVTRLARKLGVLDLARMIGHNDLKSLRVYYNATPEEIASRLD